jgi:hypothetical protein
MGLGVRDPPEKQRFCVTATPPSTKRFRHLREFLAWQAPLLPHAQHTRPATRPPAPVPTIQVRTPQRRQHNTRSKPRWDTTQLRDNNHGSNHPHQPQEAPSRRHHLTDSSTSSRTASRRFFSSSRGRHRPPRRRYKPPTHGRRRGHGRRLPREVMSFEMYVGALSFISSPRSPTPSHAHAPLFARLLGRAKHISINGGKRRR